MQIGRGFALEKDADFAEFGAAGTGVVEEVGEFAAVGFDLRAGVATIAAVVRVAVGGGGVVFGYGRVAF